MLAAFFLSAPPRPVLVLSGAALAFYTASRLGAAALDRRNGSAAGAAAAHWLPMAAVALAALRTQPQVAVSVIFAGSVACLTLVLGVILVSAPRAKAIDGALHSALAAQRDRRAWAMVLPAGLLMFLAGFSGKFTLFHAVLFLVQGLVALMLWRTRDDIGRSAEQDSPIVARKSPRSISLLIVAWIVLTLIGALLAMSAVREITAQVPQLTSGIVAALMIAPALVLPMIGSGMAQVREHRRGAAVSTSISCVLLNLCLLLPLTIVTHRVAAAVERSGWGSLMRGAWLEETNPPLAFPMVVWRIDTVLLIALGAALVPISAGRWMPRRTEGAALVLMYVIYMSVSAALAGR